jgi:hypothetical protein
VDDQPWHALPAQVAEVLRPVLADVADEMIAAVGTVPAYARPIEGPFGLGVKAGVEEALRHFVAEIQAGGRVSGSDVYVALGRGEVHAGRTLDALMSAYRIGARVAWRRFAAAGVAAGLEPDVLYALAESIFAYIDELSAQSAEGFALEQSAAAGEAELRRRRLVRLLVREPPADVQAVEVAARDAGWPPPRSLAVLAIGGQNRDAAASRLAPDVIAETIGDIVCALVPDPDGPGRRAELERAIAGSGARAGLGWTVAWADAALSFTRARAALELALADPESGLVVARERAGELLLRGDPMLADELAADRLAPLAELPAGSRSRLTETLEVWLEEQGRLASVAKRLDVHPQTARYRLARLKELFGGALDDPDARFDLELALRAGREERPGQVRP